jgi:hypothetical protein
MKKWVNFISSYTLSMKKISVINCCKIDDNRMSLRNEMQSLLAAFDPGTFAYCTACADSFYVPVEFLLQTR